VLRGQETWSKFDTAGRFSKEIIRPQQHEGPCPEAHQIYRTTLPKRAPRQTTTPRRPPPSSDPVDAAIMRASATANLTQAQLADRLKTDQGNVARLERGRTQANIRTLKRIAEATSQSRVVDFQPIKKRPVIFCKNS
jgi:ribosome-binding protein aMBF1 (putative translation factor)